LFLITPRGPARARSTGKPPFVCGVQPTRHRGGRAGSRVTSQAPGCDRDTADTGGRRKPGESMTTATEIQIDDVAALMAADYDDVSADVRRAVLDAILERGDDPDSDLVESLPVTVRAWDDGSSEETEVDHGDDYEDAARDLWDGADYGDGDYCVDVRWTATDAAGKEVDSGSFELTHQTEEPDCPEADEHDWTSEHEGGCAENPGVWSTGGTSMLFIARCKHCGMKRQEHTTGSQRNPGECDTTTYSEPDPEWVRHYGD